MLLYLWSLVKKFQNWIVDRSTAHDFTVYLFIFFVLFALPFFVFTIYISTSYTWARSLSFAIHSRKYLYWANNDLYLGSQHSHVHTLTCLIIVQQTFLILDNFFNNIALNWTDWNFQSVQFNAISSTLGQIKNIG